MVEQRQGQQSTRRLADHADTSGHGHRLTPTTEFHPARLLRLQHRRGTQIHARGPVEPIATWHSRTSNHLNGSHAQWEERTDSKGHHICGNQRISRVLSNRPPIEITRPFRPAFHGTLRFRCIRRRRIRRYPIPVPAFGQEWSGRPSTRNRHGDRDRTRRSALPGSNRDAPSECRTTFLASPMTGDMFPQRSNKTTNPPKRQRGRFEKRWTFNVFHMIF